MCATSANWNYTRYSPANCFFCSLSCALYACSISAIYSLSLSFSSLTFLTASASSSYCFAISSATYISLSWRASLAFSDTSSSSRAFSTLCSRSFCMAYSACKMRTLVRRRSFSTVVYVRKSLFCYDKLVPPSFPFLLSVSTEPRLLKEVTLPLGVAAAPLLDLGRSCYDCVKGSTPKKKSSSYER